MSPMPKRFSDEELEAKLRTMERSWKPELSKELNELEHYIRSLYAKLDEFYMVKPSEDRISKPQWILRVSKSELRRELHRALDDAFGVEEVDKDVSSIEAQLRRAGGVSETEGYFTLSARLFLKIFDDYFTDTLTGHPARKLEEARYNLCQHRDQLEAQLEG